MRDNKVTIKIPRPLYQKLKGIIKDTGFSSVTEFVTYVMRDLVSEKVEDAKGELTPEEISKIRQRLRKLGYID